MEVIFRGVRGSVPWSTAAAMRVGCNTPCLEIRDEAVGMPLLLDAGTGIAGVTLAGPPGEIAVLLTHYHWDHVQGLPFFAALHDPGWRPCVFAPALPTAPSAWLERLFETPFFPLAHRDLTNQPVVRRLETGGSRIGGFEVTCAALSHPGGAFACRVRGARGDLVYATDHELGDSTHDGPLAELARGAAALVIDAHYTPVEIARHRGWGHSDWRASAEFAARCGVGALYLFHHKPGRGDRELFDIREQARAVFPATEIAVEGLTLAL